MEENNYNKQMKIINKNNFSEKCTQNNINFRKHQLLLKSVLEKLNLDANYENHVSKDAKNLPTKYFENAKKIDKLSKWQCDNLNLDIQNEIKKRTQTVNSLMQDSSKSSSVDELLSQKRPSCSNNNDNNAVQNQMVLEINEKLKGLNLNRVNNKELDDSYEKSTVRKSHRKKETKNPSELFNPDFNFHKPIKEAGRSLLESIRSRVFSEYAYPVPDGL